MKVASRLLDAWLPPRCVAWGEPLRDADRVFCAPAADTLQCATPPRALPSGSPPRALPSGSKESGTWASFDFGGALRDAVVAAKYQPDERRARRLARFWREHLESQLPVFETAPAAIIFVPAHWRRRLARGFDFSPFLADAAGHALGLAVHDLLVCTRHEAPLSAATSKAAREVSAQDRYALRKTRAGLPCPAGATLLLIDDVSTTGATLLAASAPLLAAGFEVETLVLARTPL